MKFLRLVLSYAVAMAVYSLSYVVVDRFIPLSSHLDLFYFMPVFIAAWIGAYRLMVRTGFPPTDDPPEPQDGGQ